MDAIHALTRRIGHREVNLQFSQRVTPLPAMPLACGISRVRGPEYDWHGLKRGDVPYAAFQYTIAGQGTLVFEGRELAVRPGSAMLLCFPHDHRYFCALGRSWEFLYVSLYGREILRLWREAIDRMGPLVSLEPEGHAIGSAVELCERSLTGKLDSPFIASGLAWNLAMAVLDELTPNHATTVPSWAARVSRYCRANLRRPIGVEDMAQRAGLSRYHFTRVFREVFGVTPGRYLDELRLKEALRLLHDTALPITDVAERCGYSDRNYFTKAFGKHYGMTPSSARQGKPT